MNKDEGAVPLPFQVEAVIDSMMNKKDPAHIRYNYRMRLEGIRDAIDKSLKKYDEEMFMHPHQGRKKRG
jgi:hypothetical protein